MANNGIWDYAKAYLSSPISTTGAAVDAFGRVSAGLAPWLQKPLEKISGGVPDRKHEEDKYVTVKGQKIPVGKKGEDISLRYRDIPAKAGEFLFKDAAEVMKKINEGAKFDDLSMSERIALASVPAEAIPGVGLIPDIYRLAKASVMGIGKSALKTVDDLITPVGVIDAGIPMKIDDAIDMTKMEMSGGSPVSAAVTKIPKNLPMLNLYKDFINKTFSKPIKNISTEEHLIDSLSAQLGHTSKNQTFRVIKEMKDTGLFNKSASKNYDDYLINRSAKVNKGLLAMTTTKAEKIASENSSKINNLINENYPNFKELSDLEKATILDDITTKVMKSSDTSISNFKKGTLRNRWNKLTGDDVKSFPHAKKLEAGKKVKLTWNETSIFDPASPNASALNAKLQGNLRKDRRFDANFLIDDLRKNNPRVNELLNTIEGFKNIQSKTGAKNIGKRIYEVDHVQDFRFGGINELDNFYITTKMPHRGLKKATALFKKIYPDKVMKSKSAFGDVVHRDYLTIIEHLKKGNFEAAEKLSMKTQKYIDDVIESKPAYSFIIDEPHKAHKTGTRYNEAEYINQVSLLPKELQAKAKELIKRREYVPDMFKTNLKGEERIIKQLEDFRDTTFNIPVDVRETQRFFNRGGLVGISQLTRPIQNFY